MVDSKNFGDSNCVGNAGIYKNQNSITLQKSILSYSIPKTQRFVDPKGSTSEMFYELKRFFQGDPKKGTSFGVGERKFYPPELIKNMR